MALLYLQAPRRGFQTPCTPAAFHLAGRQFQTRWRLFGIDQVFRTQCRQGSATRCAGGALRRPMTARRDCPAPPHQGSLGKRENWDIGGYRGARKDHAASRRCGFPARLARRAPSRASCAPSLQHSTITTEFRTTCGKLSARRALLNCSDRQARRWKNPLPATLALNVLHTATREI